MSALNLDHKVHEFFEHLKINWAESLILAIFVIALMCLVLTSSVSYS
ncbi:MAG: hypothetical protein AB8B92_05425 [Gammaproteobacteria bacterium]